MKIHEVISKNKEAIILIDMQIPGEGNQKKWGIRGTGFIISKDGTFVTNAHVYKQIPENELQYIGASVPAETNEKQITRYDRFPIKLLKLDEENDVALMQIVSEKKFANVVAFGDSETVHEGEDVIYMGYPLATEMLTMGFGITMTTNKCIVSSVKRRMDGSLHFFLIDTHVNNGSSGSPLFNEDGHVIGIISAKIAAKIQGPNNQVLDIPANIGICRPAKYIEKLIK